MTSLFSIISPVELALACLIATSAGLIKGMVGFAMPMIFMSGIGSFLSPELALAGLILPTLVTNGMQALRHGASAAFTSMRKFRVFLLAGLVCLVLSAQLVRSLPESSLLLAIGVPITLFTVFQLAGMRLILAATKPWIEAAVGALAGFIGGLSGVWGPPTVAYLTALNTPKAEQMRIQGVIYGLGALALLGAHFGSGVIRAETLPLSLALIPPAVLGMWIGGKFQNRIDQATFRRATLIVLLIAGLNLVRRGLMGL